MLRLEIGLVLGLRIGSVFGLGSGSELGLGIESVIHPCFILGFFEIFKESSLSRYFKSLILVSRFCMKL